MIKICKRCKIEKTFDNFCKDSKALDGLQRVCKSCNAEQQKDWRSRNKERNSINVRNGVKAHYDRFKKENGYSLGKFYERDNIILKISKRLRSRFNQAFKRNSKVGSAVKDLGCSIEDFKNYLESKFQEGMTWDNYGQWHIDHVKPLSSFNLMDIEEVIKACHYTNLQPLWAKDNLSKSNKIIG